MGEPELTTNQVVETFGALVASPPQQSSTVSEVAALLPNHQLFVNDRGKACISMQDGAGNPRTLLIESNRFRSLLRQCCNRKGKMLALKHEQLLIAVLKACAEQTGILHPTYQAIAPDERWPRFHSAHKKETAMPVVTLTQAGISSLAPKPGKKRTEWCDKLHPGLYAESRLTAPGEVTYYLRYKDAGKTTHHLKLGSSKEITLAEARACAKAKKAEIQLGADPSAAKRAQKAVPTLKTFVTEQYLPYITPRKRSAKDDENRLNHRILPKFGNFPLNMITRKDVVDYQTELKAEGLAGATCDQLIVLIRRILNLAVEWEVIPTNPTAKIALLREPNRVEHFLNDEQLTRLLAALKAHPRQLPCQLFIFLLSTGARLNEGLSMTWDQANLQSRIWTIPAANSKSKRLRAVPLNDTALRVLEELRPENAEGRVFVDKKGKPIKSVQRVWESVRKTAGVPFLRIHDLRHSFASMLINSGRTLYEVQCALGHSTPDMTIRYAHLHMGTLQDAAATADARIQNAMPKYLPAPLPQSGGDAG